MIPAGSRARIPLVVAANGPRTMRIAAGADGWATTGPESTDATHRAVVGGVAGLVRRFEDTARQAGRDPAAMGRYLNLDSAPVLSVSSMDAFTDAAGRAAALGFTDVVVHWPRPDGVYAADEAVLDAIADLLTDGELTARLTGARSQRGWIPRRTAGSGGRCGRRRSPRRRQHRPAPTAVSQGPMPTVTSPASKTPASPGSIARYSPQPAPTSPQRTNRAAVTRCGLLPRATEATATAATAITAPKSNPIRPGR